ncbi:hypothetical protein KA082_01185 [Candidatus Woesebacteria bacterium]|nr:hypothetical protein [Candidatus Woesebacteria bacterium]
MNQPLLTTTSAPKSPQSAVNPFARALAETEQSTYSKPNPPQEQQSPFNDTLARTGGNFGDLSNGVTPDFLAQQQAEMRKQQEREALRKKLHDQINPVDTTALFDAREKEVKQQIDQLRAELKMLGREVVALNKEIEMTLLTEITEPGQSGSYFINFFHQLRSFILLLREKIKSASTWVKASQGKKKKKSKQPGLQIGGQDHEKTSTVQDMMHHERSTNYGGS